MANRIKELRKEKQMTQVRLGIELNVTQETISAYEIGKHQPSVEILLKISQIFDASLDYIMGLSELRRPLDIHNLPRDEGTLLSLYHRLDTPKKELAVTFIKGLLGEM